MRCPSLWPEGLERRGLLTAGVSAGLGVIEDLGEVSRAAATRGVEVTAPIAAEGSVTFRFGAQAAGDYILKVRYTGEGLALEARGPSGEAAITPGPAGPFATVHLPLESASYAITATALGDRPVFVDWELLLSSGVGQGAAQAPALVSPSAAIPLPTPSAQVAPSPSSSPSIMPANSAPAISFSMVVVGGPLGRAGSVLPIAPVGPIAPGGLVAMAYAGEGLPVGIASTTVPTAGVEVASSGDLSSSTASTTLEILGDVERDQAALADPSWFGQLAGSPGRPMPGSGPTEGPADPAEVEAGVGPLALATDQVRMTGSSLEMIAGVAVAVALVRRWRPRLGAFPKRRRGPSKAIALAWAAG